RAGAEYGLTFALPIVLVCLLKYPVFRFAAVYAAATGNTLIEGYARRGRGLVAFMLAAALLEGLGAVAGVGLVTAGIAKLILGLHLTDLTATLGLLAGTAALLLVGRYRVLENLTRVFVVAFSVLTVAATVAALPSLAASTTPLAAPFVLDAAGWSFLLAVSGWMPIGNVASIMLAAWVCAKSQALGRRVAVSEARFDVDLGYFASLLLALCFLLMGTGVLLGRGIALPAGSADFAALLVKVFAATIGAWVRWPVAVAALAVMYSTLLAIMDGFPRLYADFGRQLGLLSRAPDHHDRQYRALLLAVPVFAGGLLRFFLTSFGAFIDLVTTVAFMVAPVVALVNQKVVTSEEVPAEYRPSRLLLQWNQLAIGLLVVASLAYLYLKLGSGAPP
ncbi:MAG: hypothetical protein ABIL09_23750, partial [Gemmatimonadota bacterium]